MAACNSTGTTGQNAQYYLVAKLFLNETIAENPNACFTCHINDNNVTQTGLTASNISVNGSSGSYLTSSLVGTLTYGVDYNADQYADTETGEEYVGVWILPVTSGTRNIILQTTTGNATKSVAFVAGEPQLVTWYSGDYPAANFASISGLQVAAGTPNAYIGCIAVYSNEDLFPQDQKAIGGCLESLTLDSSIPTINIRCAGEIIGTKIDANNVEYTGTAELSKWDTNFIKTIYGKSNAEDYGYVANVETLTVGAVTGTNGLNVTTTDVSNVANIVASANSVYVTVNGNPLDSVIQAAVDADSFYFSIIDGKFYFAPSLAGQEVVVTYLSTDTSYTRIGVPFLPTLRNFGMMVILKNNETGEEKVTVEYPKVRITATQNFAAAGDDVVNSLTLNLTYLADDFGFVEYKNLPK